MRTPRRGTWKQRFAALALAGVLALSAGTEALAAAGGGAELLLSEEAADVASSSAEDEGGEAAPEETAEALSEQTGESGDGETAAVPVEAAGSVEPAEGKAVEPGVVRSEGGVLPEGHGDSDPAEVFEAAQNGSESLQPLGAGLYQVKSSSPYFKPSDAISGVTSVSASDVTGLRQQLYDHPELVFDVDTFERRNPGASVEWSFFTDEDLTEPLTSGMTDRDLTNGTVYGKLVAHYTVTLDLRGLEGQAYLVGSQTREVHWKSISTVSGGDLVARYEVSIELSNVSQPVTLPAAAMDGYSFAGWMRGTTNLRTSWSPAGSGTDDLTANWSSANSVEFQFLSNEADAAVYGGVVGFSDAAIAGTKYQTVPAGTTSQMTRYRGERIDGRIDVETGKTIGSSFSNIRDTSWNAGFTAAPSLDPMTYDPATYAATKLNYRAVFLGWRVSTNPNRIYSSDEMADLVVKGSMFVWAEWETNGIVTVHFKPDAETSYMNDYLRRESGTQEVLRNVPEDTDLRDLMYREDGCTIEPHSTKNETFYWWREKSGLLETDWVFNTDTDGEDVQLDPFYGSGMGVKGVRISNVKVGSGKAADTHVVTPVVGQKVTLTARVLSTNGNTPANLSWRVIETNEDGVEKEVTKEGVITVLASKASKGGVLSQNNSFTAKKAGTIVVEVSVSGNGGVQWKDRLTVMVRVKPTGLVWGNDPEGEDTTEEKSVTLKDESYASSDFKVEANIQFTLKPGSTPVKERLYVSSTKGFEEDDFISVRNLNTELVDNGKTVEERHYIETTTKKNKLYSGLVTLSLVVPQNDLSNEFYERDARGNIKYVVDALGNKVASPARKSHGGVTTLTLSTEDGKYSLKLKVIVAGYDEDSGIFYDTKGMALTDKVRTVYTGNMQQVWPVDFYFDAEGIGWNSGLIQKKNGEFILIDDTSTDMSKRGRIVERGARIYFDGMVNREYYVLDSVVQSGWVELPKGWRYYDKENGYEPAVNSWIETDSKRFFTDDDGYVVTGMIEAPTLDGRPFRKVLITEKPVSGGSYYYLSSDSNTLGQMQTGWVKEKALIGNVNEWWYDKKTGKRALTDTAVLVDDKLYFNSEESGRISGAKGWIKVESNGMAHVTDRYNAAVCGVGDYYVSNASTGALSRKALIKTDEGTWYAGDKGVTLSGMRNVDGTQYFFDSANKNMAAVTTSDTKGYFVANGTGNTRAYYHLEKSDKTRYQKWTDAEIGGTVLDKVWIENENGSVRFYVVKGKTVTGWKTIDKVKYYFREDCVLLTPQVATAEEKKISYGAGSDALMVAEVKKKKYCIGYGGELLTNAWIGPKGLKGLEDPMEGDYYANKSGILATGKQTIQVGGAKRTYYFNTQTGVKLKSDVVRIGKTVYYLNESGAVDNYSRVSNSWITETDPVTLKTVKKWYVTKAGVVKTGWVKDNGLYYYVDADGNKLTGLQIDTIAKNSIYYLDPDRDGARLQKTWDAAHERYYNNSGKALTGRKKVDGSYYIFDENGVCYKESDVVVDYETVHVACAKVGKKVYRVNEKGVETQQTEGVVAAWTRRNAAKGEEEVAYFNVKANGAMVTGLVGKGSVASFFIKATGERAESGIYQISSSRWGYFNDEGILQRGVPTPALVRSVGDDIDSGNLNVEPDTETGLIKAFKDDRLKQLKNAIITLADGEQYIIGNDGKIATGWYNYQDPKTKKKYKYYIATSGRLIETRADYLSVVQKDGSPLLKVGSKYYYQTDKGIVMATNTGGIALESAEGNYYVNKSGEVQFSKKLTVNSRPIFVNDKGLRGNGWFYSGGWYYVVDGSPLKGVEIVADTGSSGAIAGRYWDSTLSGFKNTATGQDISAICETGYTGKQSTVWREASQDGFGGLEATETKLNGTFEYGVKQDDGTIRYTVYTFADGVMKTGGVKVFDSRSNSNVSMSFNKYTGQATYTRNP